jgi:hypothetical protein
MMPNPDPTSLDNLHDIVAGPPIPISFAPGLYFLTVAAFALIGWAVWYEWRRWKANAYRRAALGELKALEARASSADQRGQALADVAALLKRTALAAWPRETVASLSGADWLEFLDRTGAGPPFSKGAGRLIAEIPYNPRAAEHIDAKSTSELFEIAKSWVTKHEACNDHAALTCRT